MSAAVPVAAATTEAQVKAAYLYKLASFVRWPAPPEGASFRICTAGRPDIYAVLVQLARNEQIGGKPIEPVDVAGGSQLGGCQILFLGRGGDLARALAAASARAPVLTVTDRDGGTRGGAVEFVEAGGKVRFVVDRREAESRRLELSSKLLDVALQVKK